LNNQLPIADLFVRYLENNCTADEVRQLLKYFDSGENEEVLRALIQAELGFTDQSKETTKRTEAAIAKVRSIILQEIRGNQEQEPQYTKPAKSFIMNTWLKACAALLIFGCSALVYWHIGQKAYQKQQLKQAVTQPGKRKLLQLFDGTKIWLCPSSSLQYPDQLTGNYREVKLEGEAFFEVAKDKVHPFIIHSGRMQTQVVGTSFNIQAYKKQDKLSVTVVTGIVKVTGTTASGSSPAQVMLKPNQRALFNPKTGSLTGENYPDAQQMLKRKDGILTYNGTPIQKVIADFRLFYNLPIELENNATGCLCYGEFNTNRPVNIVLEQLAAAIIGKVIFEKDRYILKGGCDER
jgi:ferric-dicitrate binding protein FerR (iron transport regulator)